MKNPLFRHIDSSEAVIWGYLYFHGKRGLFMRMSYHLLSQANSVLWWIRYRTTHRNHIINIGYPGYYDADELILNATRAIFFRHIELYHLNRHTGKLVSIHEGDEKWFDLYRRWQSVIEERKTNLAVARKLNTGDAWYVNAEKEHILEEREQELYMELACCRRSLWT